MKIYQTKFSPNISNAIVALLEFVELFVEEFAHLLTVVKKILLLDDVHHGQSCAARHWVASVLKLFSNR